MGRPRVSDLSALDVIVDSWRQTFHLCPHMA